MQVQVKRVYEQSSAEDGRRVLVDRLWPRGVSRDQLRMDEWMKDVAPSTELRKWFAHDPAKWDEFRQRYFVELNGKTELVAKLRTAARAGRLTLLYSARDCERNQAVALAQYLALGEK